MDEETNNNGGTQTAWYEAEGIDTTLVNDKIKSFGDVNALLKSYNESQSYIGGAVKIPNEKSTPEDVAAFYGKLGRPESADKYEWNPPEGISVEGVTDGEFKKFKELAYDAGLSNKQLGAVMGGWSEIVKSLQTKQAEFLATQSANTTAVLKKEWGDDYQERFDLTMKKLDALGIRKHMESTGILTPEMVKGFYGMISGKEETALKGGKGESASSQVRLAELKSNPAYLNAGHPDHVRVLEEINNLIAQ